MAVFGDTLRQARAYKGVTLREAEQATRISRHHLAALEEENFESLPPLIYQRGIVRNYATYLDLDPNKLLELFEEARGVQPDDPPPVMPLQPLEMPSHWAPNFAIIAFMVVMSAIVFAWLYSAYFAPTDVTSTPTEFIATVTPVDADTLFIPSPTPRPPTATPTPLPSPTPTETPEPSPTPLAQEEQDAGGDNAISARSAGAAEDAPPATRRTEGDTPIASIKITALAGIWVDVITDGVAVYSGYLETGQETGWFTGSEFIVYTSDGVNTQFTNDAGTVFLMTFDPGPGTFVLTAGVD